MNIVREIDVSSDSDNIDSSDIDFHDSSYVCGWSLSSSSSSPVDSCNLLQTDPREESENRTENADISATQKRAQSLLEVLKCPQSSTLARKRVITTNNPPTGKRSCKSTNQSKAAASIKPQQRINEFKGERLCVSSGKLFCKACREEVNLKKSSVKNHI